MQSDLVTKQILTSFKIGFTGIVTVYVVGILLWEHTHGGVQSHHILHNENLPSLSNWWSGLILPALTWFLSSRIEKRVLAKTNRASDFKSSIYPVFKLMLVGLLLGLLLAISFTFDFRPFLDNVLYILLLVSLLFPIYFSEFVIGFVLGMTFTFGAILPTLFIGIMAGIGFLIFRFIRPIIVKLIHRFGK